MPIRLAVVVCPGERGTPALRTIDSCRFAQAQARGRSALMISEMIFARGNFKMLEVVYEGTRVRCKTLRPLFEAIRSATLVWNQRRCPCDDSDRVSLFSDNADFSISFEGGK